ncbi:PXMP2/4 family protein 4-like [Chenopodium quinoa]|uniref:PXMP2/4 family protein 4-like n=1 Tax=Chenopodium quinoa TaxID=63459 RepID=UPI000B76EC3B|nr:PXMP2/4 family protein 4-like [Chenopodium quinoa]
MISGYGALYGISVAYSLILILAEAEHESRLNSCVFTGCCHIHWTIYREKIVESKNLWLTTFVFCFQGWTIFEILRYAPQHNWSAYEEILKTNPVLAKMVISGVVYSIGDWIAQCYEGKPLFEFDRTRMLRSGLAGFALHGSLSHYYYELCEALFPFQDWWAVPIKVAFDQTIWSGIWNSIYFVVLGLLRLESPVSIFKELKGTFLPMLTAGWKLWPFAHLVTYGVIPIEQRLLWVDCVELIWVTILST